MYGHLVCLLFVMKVSKRLGMYENVRLWAFSGRWCVFYYGPLGGATLSPNN